jgi:HD-GYP domain-containing protein (c-di-GMP phosphodiesterase class II)
MGAVEIAAALAASRKAVRLYPPEHPAHREALGSLVAAVTDAVDVRPVVLNLRDGRLYEGSDVITEASPAARALAEAMETRRVESLTFHMGFNETDGTGLSEVLSLRPSPELQVASELEDRAVRAVTVSELEDNLAREAEERDRRRETDRGLYRQAIRALKNVTADLQTGGAVESVEPARAVAQLIERVAESPTAVLSLALMTGHGDPWLFHSVAVMLYSLVIGSDIGSDDKELLSLGVAALLHDMGAAPDQDGDRPSDLHAESHPLAGAYALGGLVEGNAFPLLVSYEHHMGVDGSGHPSSPSEHEVHPYSRIVAVADRYDRLLRDADSPARPDQALQQVLREASNGPLDPVAACTLARSVGPIPIGTAVRLTDHSVGIVRSVGGDALRPPIRLVIAGDGSELKPAPDIDLQEDEREVADVLDRRLLDLEPSEYL